MNGKTILNGTTQPLLVKFADSGKKLRPRPAPVQTVYSNVPQMDISVKSFPFIINPSLDYFLTREAVLVS